MKFILPFLLMLTGALASQNSNDAKKTTVAVLPLDAIALATQDGAKITLIMTDSSVTREESAPNIFADKAAIASFADAATQKVVNAFLDVKRIRVVERTMMDRILKEQDFQMSDLSEGNEGVKIGSLLGAEYIVAGQLQQVSVAQVEETWMGATSFAYTATADINLRVINVSTAEVIASKNFQGATGFLSKPTPSEAAYFALDKVQKDIGEWLRRAFPAEGFIYEIKKAKKGEAKLVVITCGKELGIRKDDAFKVYYETEVDIDGRIVKKSSDIGKLVVKKVEQDGVFSQCEVDKGGKQIAEHFAAGKKLKVVQTKK